jgi:hypothetical protein
VEGGGRLAGLDEARRAGMAQHLFRDPWSEMDLADLEELLGSGSSIESVADYLCREVEEVEVEAKLRGWIPSIDVGTIGRRLLMQTQHAG